MALMEALMAVAILGICLATLSPLVFMGERFAREAEEETYSTVLARSLFDRIEFAPESIHEDTWTGVEGRSDWEYRFDRETSTAPWGDVVDLTLRKRGSTEWPWRYRRFVGQQSLPNGTVN